MEVVQLQAENSVHWRCIDAPAEELDSRITFDLSPAADQIISPFGPRQWRETGANDAVRSGLVPSPQGADGAGISDSEHPLASPRGFSVADAARCGQEGMKDLP